MTPLIIRRKEPGEVPWYEYKGREFFKLFGAMAWPYGKEPGATVIIGETFEKVPEMGRLILTMIHENPSVPLEHFSNTHIEEFKQSYCLEKIWGDPRNDLNFSEIPKIHRDKVNTVSDSINFIESILARKILRLDDQQTALLKQLPRLKSAQGSLNQYPLIGAWFYALTVADVHQTATYEEPGPVRFIQRRSITEYDEFGL
ncbi:MAG: hypothetical protein GTN76_09460 [Candidatus Aenigmarchaeota archaeon]|nr:hypothetical protein [Candidatus Aenigmarchaeota archaeon]